MKEKISKVTNRLTMTAMGIQNRFNKMKGELSKKDAGDATIVVVIALVFLALIIVVVFKDEVFEPIKGALSTLGDKMDSVFNFE